MRRTPTLLAALLAAVVVLAGCGTDERGVDMVGDRVTAEADLTAEADRTVEVWWENEPVGDSCVVVIDGEDADIVSRDPAEMTEDELAELCHLDTGDTPPAPEPEETPVIDDAHPLALDEMLTSDQFGGLPVVRTDFTDDAAWAELTRIVTAEVELDGAGPYVPGTVPIDDPTHDGLTPAGLFDAYGDRPRGHVALADARTMRELAAGGEVTVLVVDLVNTDAEAAAGDFTRELRVTTTELPSVEANLSILNLWLWEYADTADPDGVYRGYPE